MRVRVRSAVPDPAAIKLICIHVAIQSVCLASAIVRMIAKMPAPVTSLFVYGVLTLYLPGFAAGIASCVRIYM